MKKQISKQKYFDKSKTAGLRLGAKVTYDIYDKPISFYLCVCIHTPLCTAGRNIIFFN